MNFNSSHDENAELPTSQIRENVHKTDITRCGSQKTFLHGRQTRARKTTFNPALRLKQSAKARDKEKD